MPTTDLHYAILGDGRLARHMRRYLGLLGLRCSGWARNPASPFNSHPETSQAARLRRTVEHATHVLVLVRDDAIAALVRRYPELRDRALIHCAGAFSLPGVAGAHPLMTFAEGFYTLEEYRAIPFMVESGYRFSDLFPALPNPHFSIDARDKAFYHALCVMAGNFPQILWRAVSDRFERQLGMPGDVLRPYLGKVLENFLGDSRNALTGPLARGDEATVQRNLAALADDPLAGLYRAFRGFHAREASPAQAMEQVS